MHINRNYLWFLLNCICFCMEACFWETLLSVPVSQVYHWCCQHNCLVTSQLPETLPQLINSFCYTLAYMPSSAEKPWAVTVKKENDDALAILFIYQLHPLPFYLTPQIWQPSPLLMHIAKPVITHGPPAVFSSMNCKNNSGLFLYCFTVRKRLEGTELVLISARIKPINCLKHLLFRVCFNELQCKYLM